MTRTGNLPAAISMWGLHSVILRTAATRRMLSTASGGTGHIIAVHGGEWIAHLLQMRPCEYHKYRWADSVSKCAYWPTGHWQKLSLCTRPPHGVVYASDIRIVGIGGCSGWPAEGEPR
jgi:hypothetical protein